MKNENFITIQGWMRKELGLSGNELLAYALIYGFSQDSESTFRGSLSYVAEWLGCSKQTAITTLRKLVEKNFIERIEEPINGILFVRYRVLTTSQNSLTGESKNLTTPSQNFLPNSNNINNQEDKKEKEIKEKVPTEEILNSRLTDTVIGSMINEYTQNPKLNEALRSFIGYRKKKRAPMSDVAVRLMLKKLAPFSEDEQIEAIETSIVSNWAGVFPKHKSGKEEQKNVGKVAHGNEDYNEDFDMESYMERRRRQG